MTPGHENRKAFLERSKTDEQRSRQKAAADAINGKSREETIEALTGAISALKSAETTLGGVLSENGK